MRMRITISRCWFQQEITVWGYHCQKPVNIMRLCVFLLVYHFVIQEIWTAPWKDIRRIKRSSFPQWCKILGGEKSKPLSNYYKTNGSLIFCVQPYPVTGAALCQWVPASAVIAARCDSNGSDPTLHHFKGISHFLFQPSPACKSEQTPLVWSHGWTLAQAIRVFCFPSWYTWDPSLLNTETQHFQ